MTTPPDELVFLERALRYLDGKLGEDDARAFERVIASDPARMRRFARLAMQRVHLAELGKVSSALPLARGRTRARVGLVAGAACAAAAMVALALGPAWRGGGPTAGEQGLAEGPSPLAVPAPDPVGGAAGAQEAPRAEPAPRAWVEAVRGEVTVVLDGVSARARAGKPLGPGEALAIGGDPGRATVRIERGGRLELGAGTTVGALAPLRVEGPPGRAGVALPVTQGRIHAEWHGEGVPVLALVTPLGEVRASRGSHPSGAPVRFRLEVQPDETRVEVHQGALRLTTFATGRTVDLDEGTLAVLGPERDPQIERDEPPLAVVFDLQASPRELPLLRRAPERLLRALRGWEADADGMVNYNRQGFRCVGEQRHVLAAMVVGAALGDKGLIDRAWAVVDSTMKFQAPDGSFLDPPVCDADWLGELMHALSVLMESEWERPYRRRIKALLPRLARTAGFLAEPRQVEALKEAAKDLSKHHFLHGAAFVLSGMLLEDERLRALGREFVAAGLAQQRPDGAFVVYGGTDTVYQGIILQHLAWTAFRLPDPRYEEAMRLGVSWLYGRITAAGEIDVRGNTRSGPSCRAPTCIGVDWQRIAWGLLYSGLRGEPRGVELAQRLRERRRAILP